MPSCRWATVNGLEGIFGSSPTHSVMPWLFFASFLLFYIVPYLYIFLLSFCPPGPWHVSYGSQCSVFYWVPTCVSQWICFLCLLLDSLPSVSFVKLQCASFYLALFCLTLLYPNEACLFSNGRQRGYGSRGQGRGGGSGSKLEENVIRIYYVRRVKGYFQ